MNKRPPLTKDIKLADFKAFYWLKNELVAFCKQEGIPRTGGKIEITNRIIDYLETGKIVKTKPVRNKATSRFDWNTATLTLQTIITDSYKNTENVRQFFIDKIGRQFKYNVEFMNWMKNNQGKTMSDAIQEWHNIKEKKANNKGKKEIAPQFEYNAYIRDFLADNPNLSRQDAIKCWKVKKSLRGTNAYEKSDLDLQDD